MHKKWVMVHPAALAFTAALAKTVTFNGGRVVGKVEMIPSLPYLIRMKLFNFVPLNYGKDIKEHEQAGRFIPLTNITKATEIQNFIIDMVPLLHAPPDKVAPIKYVFSELLRNALEHSKSQIGPVICAQYYKDKGVLSLGVADIGIGLRESLNKFHHPVDDWHAIRLALKPGITGTTARFGGTDYNGGAGLFFTKSIAAMSRNYFVIASNTAMFKLKPEKVGKEIKLNSDPERDHHQTVVGLPKIPGTIVGIDISITAEDSFKDLMAQIRDAYRIDIKSEKKNYFKKAKFE